MSEEKLESKIASKAASFVTSSARSVVRTVIVSSLLLRKQLWIWPILAAILLSCVGWFVRNTVEEELRDNVRSEHEVVLKTQEAALRNWFRLHEYATTSLAENQRIRSIAERLAELSDKPGTTSLELLQTPLCKELRAELQMIGEDRGYDGFVLFSPGGRVICSNRNELVGLENPYGDTTEIVKKAMSGHATVTRPRKSVAILRAEDGTLKAGVPTMFAVAPVRRVDGRVFAALGLRIKPEKEFTEIFRIAQLGHTGETYAFDRNGLLLSNSRFDGQLREIGLIPEDADSILNLQIRNPGVDMVKGARPSQARSSQPMTKLAEEAIAGRPGVDVQGYRDYRGVPVVGAWTWLDDYGMGIAAETDTQEAFLTLIFLRNVFWGMFALLAIAAIAIFVFTIVVARLQRKAQMAAIEAKTLGQYKLDQKLGEGGMGVVYRAHHSMLQRPTAVKFLNVEKTNDETIARFEREVQLTSKLSHPNTIAIFDYGRTPEGIFYYAMEYLEGVDLEKLVSKYGPLPEDRAIFLLEQICGSLAEAHSIGLVHRDIKPANIIVTQRGGLYDFAKLLDFGLVKIVDQKKAAGLTSAGSMTGTPLYLSPEAIRSTDQVDARSDLYALGAVGYYLVTGTTVFDGTSVIDIIQKHMNAEPERPSKRCGLAISAEFEEIILKCLAKDPEKRPQSAEKMAQALVACKVAGNWNHRRAKEWWEQGAPATKVFVQNASPNPNLAETTLGTQIGETV